MNHECQYCQTEANDATHYRHERDAALGQCAAIRKLVDEQAEDGGLWFVAETAPEKYLQQELRRLHTLIETIDAGKELLAQCAAMRRVMPWLIKAARDGYGHVPEVKKPTECLQCDALREAEAAVASDAGVQLLAQCAAMRAALENDIELCDHYLPPPEQCPACSERRAALASDAGKQLLAQYEAMREALSRLVKSDSPDICETPEACAVCSARKVLASDAAIRTLKEGP